MPASGSTSGALALLVGVLAGCASEEPAAPGAPGPRASAVASVATFSHPQRLGFVWWSLPLSERPLRVLEQRLELPPAVDGDGVRLVLAQVQLRGPGAGEPCELQAALHADPDGDVATFARPGPAPPAAQRPSAGGFEASDAGQARVGNAFAWRPGTWIARIEWRREDAQGSWYGFTLRHERSGDFCDAGELRAPLGATLQPVIGTWAELTSGADVPGDVTPQEVAVGAPAADGRAAQSATVSYGALRNVDVHLEPAGEARFAWGGATPRRHAAGRYPLR